MFIDFRSKFVIRGRSFDDKQQAGQLHDDLNYFDKGKRRFEYVHHYWNKENNSFKNGEWKTFISLAITSLWMSCTVVENYNVVFGGNKELFKFLYEACKKESKQLPVLDS
jgi:hypothetical protein